MLRFGRFLSAAAGLVLAGVYATAVPAWADAVGGVNCVADPTNPACVVTVTSGSDAGGGGGGSLTTCRDMLGTPAPCYSDKYGWMGSDGCYYRPAPAGVAAVFGTPPPPAAWYEGHCVDTSNGFVVGIRLRVLDSPPGQGLLVAQAVRRLGLPAPRIGLNPPAPAPQVVRVPTWLWVAPVSWTTRTATASVPGLSVTATATPVAVVWSTGDGAEVTCHGPGTAWNGTADPMASSPTCGHTYTRSSNAQPGGLFTVRASIVWRIAWAGGGLNGTVPDMTSTSTVTVRVLESQAVNMAGG